MSARYSRPVFLLTIDTINLFSQVIFGTDGALAGLVGTVAVLVDVPGLPSEDDSLQLDGLPFQGSVRIGKKSMFSFTEWFPLP